MSSFCKIKGKLFILKNAWIDSPKNSLITCKFKSSLDHNQQYNYPGVHFSSSSLHKDPVMHS